MNDKPIDELVAEKVMGWIKPPETSILKSMWVSKPIGMVHRELPKFSMNMEDAWLVVDKLQDSFKSVEIFIEDRMTNVIITEHFPSGHLKDKYQGYERSAPLAICKAALKAVGEEWQ
ncbi:TPA: BC1872 family protein [Bacillus thuringiensis]|uniref:Phage ABA sandwich domain-containing protein n=1 Tax=Bacillus thuringiensis TaxID=1428 RepID=A0A9X6KMX3_BACTU|nr:MULTISPECIES: hypothetical protein [Bacillus cereus group]AJA22226.1 hypothetical protein BT4G5_26380 [Bacillus thuringiensis serovar galleriae]ETE92310.1 hypothetical protein C621_0215040 [Bacillus thuringiensis serovar aizawai str. Leapi01]ETE96296.1 hypothetical protein C623_0220140 [Bacillus thuringiensis serovar aizawai str. Hu4-2]KAB1379621.1 hypothetical protein FPG93_12280 [Bacillus thuringiensis]KLA32086.1 hypothetical protein B4158_2509 [Bacillus cereus]